MATQEYDFLIDKVGRQSTWSVSLNYALLFRPEIYEIFPHSDNHNNNNSNNNNIIMVIVVTVTKTIAQCTYYSIVMLE